MDSTTKKADSEELDSLHQRLAESETQLAICQERIRNLKETVCRYRAERWGFLALVVLLIILWCWFLFGFL